MESVSPNKVGRAEAAKKKEENVVTTSGKNTERSSNQYASVFVFLKKKKRGKVGLPTLHRRVMPKKMSSKREHILKQELRTYLFLFIE